MKILKKIRLFILKRKLKRYKKGAKYYEKIGSYNNYYNETGIPNLEKDILKLQNELE